MIYDAAVIGAGASGIMAALTCAAEGISTALIEKNSFVGRKLLSTGNGKCNFTNASLLSSCYNSTDKKSVDAVLCAFDYEDTVRFFEDLGIRTFERDGYYYPYTNSAKDVREVLEYELKSHPCIDIFTDTDIASLKNSRDHFEICSSDNRSFFSKYLIVTCGGRAAPKSGSDGSGLLLLKDYDLKLIPLAPALVPLTIKKGLFARKKGFRTKGSVDIVYENNIIASDTGELQLNSDCISGIPVLNTSRHAAVLLEQQKRVFARLDFAPGISDDELRILMTRRLYDNARQKSIKQSLVGLIPDKLIAVILKSCALSENAIASDIKKKSFEKLVRSIKHFSLEITGTKGYEYAQTTAGGVSFEELNDSLSLKKNNRIYLAGEMTDCDGICGGYNLQWAFASGYVAARSVSEELKAAYDKNRQHQDISLQ